MSEKQKRTKDWLKNCGNYVKVLLLVSVWVICCWALMTNKVKIQDIHQISISKNATKNYLILDEPKDRKLYVMIVGALLPEYYGNLSTHWLNIWIELLVLTELPKSHTEIKSTSILLAQVDIVYLTAVDCYLLSFSEYFRSMVYSNCIRSIDWNCSRSVS